MAEATKTDSAATTGIPTVTLSIDGQSTTVPKGTTVLQAARDLGITIPTFCNHPKLKPVGACRICYVEIEKMAKLQVSCSLEAMDGMVVSTDSDVVKQGRKAVLEFILLNHPLDCPTCDKGGECDLQNMTFAHGYDDSRFDFQKLRFSDEGSTSLFDDVRIGPEIILNRNRCILCYKCVRANTEAFGEYDLGAYERGNITEINAAPGQQVDNPYSGNLVEICPVGALTNSDWRYQIRVWLTQTAPSICNFTSSGTNITAYKESHKNRIYRMTSRMNDQIDDGWLADVTRYGYQIVNADARLKYPLIKKDGKQVEASWEEALSLVGKRFGEIKEKKGSVCIGGLVAPHLDNASLYGFSKFFREVLKCNNVDFRSDYRMLPSSGSSSFSALCARPFSISDIDDSELIVVFGSDLLREYRNEYLRIRKAVQFNNARVIVINPYATKAADVASQELVYAPGTEEAVLNGLCLAAIENNMVVAESASDLIAKISPSTLSKSASMSSVSPDDLTRVAQSISSSSKITIIIGQIAARSIARDSIACALANLDRLLGISAKGQMAALAKYANSRGAALLGVEPCPSNAVKARMGEILGQFPECAPHNTDDMMAQIKKEEIDGFLIMGANPMMLYPDREFVREGLEKIDFLVACDLFETETTALADVVLPLASWAEYSGDYVNLEGRVQTAQQIVRPIGQAKTGSDIMSTVAQQMGATLFESVEQQDSEIDQLLSAERSAGPIGEFLEVRASSPDPDDDYPIVLFIGDDPHHCGHLTQHSPSLSNFAGGAFVEMSPDLAKQYRLADGDSVRIESRVGKVIVPVRISSHLRRNVVIVPRNFSTTAVTILLMRKQRLDRVRISRVDE